MSARHRTIGFAALGWVALAALAAAQPAAGPADVPTGDVWITSERSAFPHGASQAASVDAQLPIGDVWLAEDGMTRAAKAPAPPHEQAEGREEIAAGSVK
jgi:hypothetical protein